MNIALLWLYLLGRFLESQNILESSEHELYPARCVVGESGVAIHVLSHCWTSPIDGKES